MSLNLNLGSSLLNKKSDISALANVKASENHKKEEVKVEENKDLGKVKEDVKNSGKGKLNDAKNVKDDAVIYEKSKEVKSNKHDIFEGKDLKNPEARQAIIDKLKADQEAQQKKLLDIVRKTISGQGNAIASADDMWKFLASGNFTVDAATKAQAKKDIAEDGYWGVEQTSDRILDFAKALSGNDPKQGNAIASADDMWKFLASGNFTVDAATKAQAKKDIAEDGYWGVEQTSDRILDFAKALSGNDPKQADKLLNAFKKGFDQATKAWGKKLPDISQRTYDAVVKKFEAWKNSQGDSVNEKNKASDKDNESKSDLKEVNKDVNKTEVSPKKNK